MGSYVDVNGRFRQTEQQFERVALGSHWLAGGTPLAAFADGASATPGLAVDNSEGVGIRWNNHATPAAIFGSIPSPSDRRPGSNMKLHIIAHKSGATVGDAVTFTCAFFNNVIGALHDADTNYGGATNAMTGNATAKTVQRCTFAMPAADLPAPSDQPDATICYSIKPTDGTLGTDDVTITAIFYEYERVVTAV